MGIQYDHPQKAFKAVLASPKGTEVLASMILFSSYLQEKAYRE